MLEVTRKGKTNYFFRSGGKDEGSQDLVQGITAAGAFFDEVALMPESFREPGDRTSFGGRLKMWFNCNPAGPVHWFKVNWIDKRRDKKLLYLHFTMDDNLSLSEKTKARYRSMYAGVFYLRYIKGLWKAAEGLIYTMFTDDKSVYGRSTSCGAEKHSGSEYCSGRWHHESLCIFGYLGRWTDIVG